MAAEIELAVDGTPVEDDLWDAIQLLQVEENADRPDTLLMRLPVNRTSAGDLEFVGDGTFEPNTNVTVVVTADGRPSECVFDGYVLSWRLHLDRTSGASTIDIWAHDASWQLNVSDSVREWSGMTDGQVANEIFSDYGFTPADENTDDDSPEHDPESHTLFQRGSDLQFLRALARRNGKLVRVACTDTPGVRTGYFVTPDIDADPTVALDITDPDEWSVDSFEFDWDVMRPTEVDASQVALDSSSDEIVDGDAIDSGLSPMDERDFPTYAGQESTLVLTPAADTAELTMRSTAALREAEWFVRCRGETSVDRLGAVLRVGTVVEIDGVGNLLSGNWLVWNVRHQITSDDVVLGFTLVRNAVGPASGGPLPGVF